MIVGWAWPEGATASAERWRWVLRHAAEALRRETPSPRSSLQSCRTIEADGKRCPRVEDPATDASV